MNMRQSLIWSVPRIFRDRQVAEDLTPETYIRVKKVADRGRADHAEALIQRTARTLALDHLRRRGAVSGGSDGSGPFERRRRSGATRLSCTIAGRAGHDICLGALFCLTHDPGGSRRTLSSETRKVSQDLSVVIPGGGFTFIVGPNACGKTTLYWALSRLLSPRAGQGLLDGKAISDRPAKEVARRLGLLTQSSTAPEGITVADLAARKVDELSGGQRQRVWIAMVLAQDTRIILLDEPTTSLDIAHQIELLDILAKLNAGGRTVVSVLHNLKHACRYAAHLVAMRDGRIVAEGSPAESVDGGLVRDVFGLSPAIITDPISSAPLVVPGHRLCSEQLERDFS